MKVLSACVALAVAVFSSVGTDGYEFQRRTQTNQLVLLTVQEYDNLADLQSAAPKQLGADVGAWSERRGVNCTIHVVKPEFEYRPARIGHEVSHCIYGDFHNTPS